MRIFDCFTFYNEFDILELRLEELWDTVDYFVIAEANLTHQNNPKPYYLKDNWARFEKYSEKIRHVLIDDMPGSPDTWINERHQRRELRRGLTDLQPTDLVIVSDCDEIPRATMIDAIRNDENDYDRYTLGIPIFYFKLNYAMVAPQTRQRNIAVVRGRAFKDPQEMREFTFHKDRAPIVDVVNNAVMVDHGGWHFTYFGDDDFAANKLRNFAHAESKHVAETVDIQFMLEHKLGFTGYSSPERFDYVVVDDYFPDAITKNLDRWQSAIVPNATASIYNYYPEE